MKRARSLGYEGSSFHGVVVCITGLSSHKKARLHEMVERLGGRYTGDLIIESTTHLIAEAAEGAKHREAARTDHIKIVKSSWLEECYKRRTRVDEKNHLLHLYSGFENMENVVVHRTYNNSYGISFKNACLQILASTPISSLFRDCIFFFFGFDDNLLESNIDDHENSNLPVQNNFLENKTLLGKLVRHGLGTRYWEFTEDITHVIVNENCDKRTLSTAQYLGERHPNQPAVLSPQWILQSLLKKSLQATRNFPARRIRPVHTSKTPSSLISTPSLASKPKLKVKSSIFQGLIFSIMQSVSTDNLFNTSTSSLEEQIISNGGTMLSKRILDALEKDIQDNQVPHRIICVVFIGRITKNYTNRNAYLAEVEKKKLCPFVPVNPNYIKCCIHERIEFLPDIHPLLFQPQPFCLHRLPEVFLSSRNLTKKSTISAAVSGFVGVQRYGIIEILKHIGADYTESLTKSNTHLICKQAEGPKFERGLIWGLHVVKVEWLYHILKYGYEGDLKSHEDQKEGKKGKAFHGVVGCEHLFCFEVENQPETKNQKPNTLEVRQKKSTTVASIQSDLTVKVENGETVKPIACTSSSQTSSSKHDAQIKSSLLKLQNPVEDSLTKNVPNRSNNTVRRARKRKPLHLSKAFDTDPVDRNEYDTNEDKSYSGNEVEEKNEIVNNTDYIEDNEDGTLGSLVESQAIWYPSNRG